MDFPFSEERVIFLKKIKRRLHLSYPRLLAEGFGLIILLGTLVLMLPISSRAGVWSPFADCLLTATSATCVTGLIVFDTYSHWSLFGQIVIITLIQIGGLGFMTLISMFVMFLRKKINLRERLLLMQSSGNLSLADVTGLIKRILLGTLLFEGLGAVALSFYFVPKLGIWKGIYNAVFHSVSAFCNAGFDLMGRVQPFSSFTSERGNVLVNCTLMALIVIGGIGFLVWNDVWEHKWRFKRYCLHSKIVLTTTLILLVGATVFFYFSETNGALTGLEGGEKWLAAAFQSVTLRTAGFNTVEQSALSGGGSILSMILMVIGGSPGSTAGGVKTVTVAVVFLTALAVMGNHREVEVYKKSLSKHNIRQAFAVIFIYLMMTFGAVILLSFIEPFGLRELFYEVCSAVGTVGITMGITTKLTLAGKLIITFLMFFGRIGGLSLAMAFSEDRPAPPLQRPEGNVLIG